MRRFLRRFFRRSLSALCFAFCLLCLLACMGTMWLWRQSYLTPPGGERHASLFLPRRQARYTMRSERGRLTLFRPPPPLPAPALPAGAVPRADDLAVAERAAQVSNRQLEWEVSRIRPTDRPPDYRTDVTGRPRYATPAGDVVRWMSRAWWRGAHSLNAYLGSNYSPNAQAAKPYLTAGSWRGMGGDLQNRLLAALEDPDRAVAAYVLLADADPFGRSGGEKLERLPDGSFAYAFGRLHVTLRPDRPFSSEAGPAHDVEIGFCSASASPAELEAAREEWHRVLDLPAGSLPHWLLVSATALPPLALAAVWSRRAWRRRQYQRPGLCRRCGYDLTGNTSGRCSECGEKIESRGSGGRM